MYNVIIMAEEQQSEDSYGNKGHETCHCFSLIMLCNSAIEVIFLSNGAIIMVMFLTYSVMID